MPPSPLRVRSRLVVALSALALVLGSTTLAPMVPSAADTTAPAATQPRTASVDASGVTYTDSRHPTTGYAARDTIRVSRSRYTGYLSFPPVELQPGESITGATLTLKVTRANKSATRRGGLVAAPVAGNWTAAGLTSRLAPKTLAGTLNKAVRARTGRTVTLRFSGVAAIQYLAAGPALRLRYTTSAADVRVAKADADAPSLEFTIAPPGYTAPFSFAVIPDTQDETTSASNPRFGDRTQYLVDNRERLNLKYVLHTGDVVNWGWLVPSQFGVATAAVQRLADAGIPYALALGNHDTSAVGWNGISGSTGYGGSAYAHNPDCPSRLGAAECRSRLLVRRTGAFNSAFPLSGVKNLGGVYEAGKVDNMWTTFEAGGTKWLVLTLELWPRTEVVAWAAKVVAGHPGHNVIVQTHSYLTARGGIDQTNGGYGAKSGQYLHDTLIAKYANIKLVFSGHTGQAARRVDRGVHGNRIVSYLQAFHSRATNPVRLVTIDPASGLVATSIVAPYTNETWSQYSTSDSLALIR